MGNLEAELGKVIKKQTDLNLIFNKGLNEIANKFHDVPGLLDEVEKIMSLARSKIAE